MFDIDVFIPTLKKRTDNLLCQVHTALNSGLNARVTISIPDNDYAELINKLTDKEKINIRLIKKVPQGEPSIPIKYCLENESWSNWLLIIADDDCLMPWGLKHLYDATPGMGMVMGQTLGVSRNMHLDFSSWKIGVGVIPCHCSTAFYNVRMLEKLSKPWCEIDPLSDYRLIQKMAENFPYKIIPSVCHVQSFAELENLGTDFSAKFHNLYGHLL